MGRGGIGEGIGGGGSGGHACKGGFVIGVMVTNEKIIPGEVGFHCRGVSASSYAAHVLVDLDSASPSIDLPLGLKTDMGCNQKAYDAECAALARAPKTSAWRQTTPERGHDLTDAQAAIKRMASEEPGPGQMYAIQARKHIAALRRARPGIIIENRWCPAP
jgi:hypothetical protein